MSNLTKEYFDVCIKVLECRGISTQTKDISTQISVLVGDDSRSSKVIQHSINPFFDEYFVFTKCMYISDFMDTLITISAYHSRKLLKVRKLIGSIRMDVATVWNQPDRQLKKWFLLSLPSDHSVQGKGFVECILKIMTPGKYHQISQLASFETSDIIGSKRARYKVLIYFGVGLQELEITNNQQISVKVFYAGKNKGTSFQKLDKKVKWNEQISFVELFPPMRQRLTLELKQGKKTLATRNFHIIEFFKIFHSGFLNMFGPTFIHLYAQQNVYRGSLLISLESEILGQLREFEHADGVTLNSIEPISQSKYGMINRFICFGIVFELVITKENCGKDNIYLSLEMGNTKKETPKYSAAQYDKFLCVPFNNNKPCLSLKSEWPDCTHRLYNSNVMASLASDIRKRLDYSKLMVSKGCDAEARNSLVTACRTFKKSYKKALNYLLGGTTELDKKYTLFLKNQIMSLAHALSADKTTENIKERCKYFLSVHNNSIDDQQDSLPLLRITLHQEKTIVGSCVVHPKDIIFSDENERKGFNSGKINYLFLKGNNKEVVAKVDIWLWLGKDEQRDKCQEQYPLGYQSFSLPRNRSLPSSLTYPSSNSYTVICHIHSGYINEEAVSEGECDPFVKVGFLNQCQQTTIAKRTLVPIWKQTLILREIKLYRSSKYLVENPPPLTIQLWNKVTDPPQFLGFGLIDSNVRLEPVTDMKELPLKWCAVGEKCEVLVACDILLATPEDGSSEELFSMRKHGNIFPRHLEPRTVSHRLEIVFWGMRPLFARALKNIVQPQVLLQCDSARISSDVIPRVNTTFNFTRDIRIVSLNLPKDRLLSPPLMIKIMSNLKYLVTLTEKNIYRFEQQLPKKSQWELLNARRPNDKTAAAGSSYQVTFPDLVPLEEVGNKRSSSLAALLELPNKIRTMMSDFTIFSNLYTDSNESIAEESIEDELVQDWWDRYWNREMKIYDLSLEDQEEFSCFTDVLSTFPILNRKDYARDFSEKGKFKAIISLYKWPVKEPVVTIQGQDPEMGILKLSELNSRINLLVRVYCVKAVDLYPSDLNAKSDPYIEIATQTKTVSDKYNKRLGELNPVFGICLEIVATLPIDSLLAVRVMDWDVLTTNDIIGETVIDIENRFYSKYRATCGLPQSYETIGPNAWRDIETPKEILERLCNTHNLPLPQYSEKSVTIGSKEFSIRFPSPDKADNHQRLALSALNHWEEMPIVGRPLVSEHVETRLLFKEDRPGLVRGRLNMWVDMFDLSLGNIPLPIDIAPRVPQAYELRVNILNTDRIPLTDELTFGDKRIFTDIIVMGWLGDPKNMQKTDVHYRSYTGEGNFNWRFVFPFLYYRKEKKMVFYNKNLFDIGKTEQKVSPVLHLKVYDDEGMLEHNLIGGMTLELCGMPRGALSVNSCKIEKVLDSSKYVDLFKVYKLRGWWPFLVDSIAPKARGFLEAEFTLITAEEARKCPVGLGRSSPNPLPIPARAGNRKTPCQVLEEIIAKHTYEAFCGLTMNIVIVLLLIVLIGVLIYTLPSMIEKLKPLLREML